MLDSTRTDKLFRIIKPECSIPFISPKLGVKPLELWVNFFFHQFANVKSLIYLRYGHDYTLEYGEI